MLESDIVFILHYIGPQEEGSYEKRYQANLTAFGGKNLWMGTPSSSLQFAPCSLCSHGKSFNLPALLSPHPSEGDRTLYPSYTEYRFLEGTDLVVFKYFFHI